MEIDGSKQKKGRGMNGLLRMGFHERRPLGKRGRTLMMFVNVIVRPIFNKNPSIPACTSHGERRTNALASELTLARKAASSEPRAARLDSSYSPRQGDDQRGNDPRVDGEVPNFDALRVGIRVGEGCVRHGEHAAVPVDLGSVPLVSSLDEPFRRRVGYAHLV